MVATLHAATVHVSTLHVANVHVSALHVATVHVSALHVATVHVSTLHCLWTPDGHSSKGCCGFAGRSSRVQADFKRFPCRSQLSTLVLHTVCN